MKFSHLAAAVAAGISTYVAPAAYAGVVVGVAVPVPIAVVAGVAAVPTIPTTSVAAIAVPAVPAYAAPIVMVPGTVVPTYYAPVSVAVWRTGYWTVAPARVVVVR